MLRFPTMTLAALAIFALPLAAVAENQTLPTASETIVLAAVEDAVPSVPAATKTLQPSQASVSSAETKRAARGSSQSMAGFRFSDAYAFPQQTLPVNFPSLPAFGF